MCRSSLNDADRARLQIMPLICFVKILFSTTVVFNNATCDTRTEWFHSDALCSLLFSSAALSVSLVSYAPAQVLHQATVTLEVLQVPPWSASCCYGLVPVSHSICCFHRGNTNSRLTEHVVGLLQSQLWPVQGSPWPSSTVVTPTATTTFPLTLNAQEHL